MYFTKHADEEVQTKAIIGLGKRYKGCAVLLFAWFTVAEDSTNGSYSNLSKNMGVQMYYSLHRQNNEY